MELLAYEPLCAGLQKYLGINTYAKTILIVKLFKYDTVICDIFHRISIEFNLHIFKLLRAFASKNIYYMINLLRNYSNLNEIYNNDLFIDLIYQYGVVYNDYDNFLVVQDENIRKILMFIDGIYACFPVSIIVNMNDINKMLKYKLICRFNGIDYHDIVIFLENKYPLILSHNNFDIKFLWNLLNSYLHIYSNDKNQFLVKNNI
jgi:hypothetical protein